MRTTAFRRRYQIADDIPPDLVWWFYVGIKEEVEKTPCPRCGARIHRFKAPAKTDFWWFKCDKCGRYWSNAPEDHPNIYAPNQKPRPPRYWSDRPPAKDKWSAYRLRCLKTGKCTHCGKPCLPYAECEERRLYKRLHSRKRMRRLPSKPKTP